MTGSHTGSQEWQSFEIRMRQRRVERCLLKADVALEAGFLGDAREALDEARSLSPSTPELIDLERRIAAFEAPLIPEPELHPIDEPGGFSEVEPLRAPTLAPETRERGRGMAIAATALLLAGAGALSVWWQPVELRPLAPAHLTPAEGLLPAASAPPVPREPSLTVATDSVTATEIQPELEPLAIGTSSTAESAQVASSGTAAVPPPTEPAPAPADTTPAAPAPPATRPTAVTPPGGPARDERPQAEPERTESARATSSAARLAVAPVTSLPESAAPVSTSVAPAPVPDPPVNSAPAVIRPDEQVRTVLGRYEAAYSSLDAAAAASVYPEIDREKLARAFDALAAQRVSLGACAIEVAGVAATANCDGLATWEPKVGGGSRTQSRSWHFELRLAGNGWRIVDATVR